MKETLRFGTLIVPVIGVACVGAGDKAEVFGAFFP
jgi:hypothetical protein